MPITTEQLLTVELPALTTVSPDNVVEAFARWESAVTEVAGARGDQSSGFDWDVAFKIMRRNNEQDGDPDRAGRVALAASQTAIALPGSRRLALHETPGVSLTVDKYGRLIGGDSQQNPKVPAQYGAGTPYALLKLGGAILVDRALQQGANSGAGYRLWATLRGAESPTIGMATARDTDGHAIAYTGATHAVSLADSAALLRARYPELDGDLVTSPDFIAGVLDSLMATVANRAAMQRQYPGLVQGIQPVSVVDFPDPSSPENTGVNWN